MRRTRASEAVAHSVASRAAGAAGSRVARLTAALAVLAALVASVALAQAPAATRRFVDLIGFDAQDDRVDVTVVFSCSMRYLTHLPASEGTEVRIELQPLADCGPSGRSLLASELPPVAGGADVLSAARVESDVPGQIALVLTWKKSERFVLAQGIDPRGLRIRLFDRARGRTGVIVNEPGDVVSNFAVNLDSEPRPFDAEAIARARKRLQAPVFVSETVVDGQKWYRLRVGPIASRKDADRLLQLALPDYPRAWLAIGDDAVTSNPEAAASAGPLPGVQRVGADPPLDEAVRRQMLSDAKGAMAARDYVKAVTLLTKLQRQPEFPERPQVQELLGLARERSGELAHAKAEYEEYLSRYPHGEGAERVALRLRTLREASAQPRTGTGGLAPATGWSVTGGFAQMYRYDGTSVNNSIAASLGNASVPTSATVSSSELFNDVDLLARHHGDRVDFLGQLSAGYAKGFSGNGLGDLSRVSIASIELSDRSLGLLARAGRQMRNEDGILGTFDGLFASYQFLPGLAVNASAGYPVELLDASVQTGRTFESLGIAYAPPGAHWDIDVFGEVQKFDGIRDREAVGLEARYLAARASLVVLTDYDVQFHSLNAAALLGTVQLPARWNVSFDAERRNAPALMASNALIGQPVTRLAELGQTFTVTQIYQLARDRTPSTDEYSLTATHPIGERFQLSLTAEADRTGATPGSGGVDAQPATGLNHLVQMQLYGASLWRTGDFGVVNLQYGDNEIGKLESLGITARFPVVRTWRIGSRLFVNRQTIESDGSTLTTLVPSALIDYQSGRKLLQIELGGEIGRRSALLQTQNSTRYYASVAYRIGF